MTTGRHKRQERKDLNGENNKDTRIIIAKLGTLQEESTAVFQVHGDKKENRRQTI